MASLAYPISKEIHVSFSGKEVLKHILSNLEKYIRIVTLTGHSFSNEVGFRTDATLDSM